VEAYACAEIRTCLLQRCKSCITTFQPDHLDIGILRELNDPNSIWSFRESYPRVAKSLGVDVETVRRRFSRMEDYGVIEGLAIVPNPILLGRECMALYFDASDDSGRRAKTESLARLDGIMSVQSFHGGSLYILLAYPDDSPALEMIATIEAALGARCALSWAKRFPKFELTMAPTDWLILRSLRKDSRRRLDEIAREAGISSRTLNRRMERLVEGDAFFHEPNVNFQRIGRLSFTMLVSYAVGPDKRAVDDLISRMVGDSLESRDTSSSFAHSVFSLFSDNLTEAKQTIERVMKLEGVVDVKMGIHEGRRILGSWVDKEIDARCSLPAPILSAPKTGANRPRRSRLISELKPRATRRQESWWSGSYVEGRRVRVTLDSAVCMGSGSCVEIAPKIFSLDHEKKKSIFDPAPLRILKDRSPNLEDVFLAAQSCPYRVIKLEDSDTGEQLFP